MDVRRASIAVTSLLLRGSNEVPLNNYKVIKYQGFNQRSTHFCPAPYESSAQQRRSRCCFRGKCLSWDGWEAARSFTGRCFGAGFGLEGRTLHPTRWGSRRTRPRSGRTNTMPCGFGTCAVCNALRARNLRTARSCPAKGTCVAGIPLLGQGHNRCGRVQGGPWTSPEPFHTERQHD